MFDVVVDVGNSTVQLAVYESDKLINKYSFKSDINKTHDEFYAILKEQNLTHNINEDKVDFILFSSVVPSINSRLNTALKKAFKNAKLISMRNKLKTSLPMKVDNPNEVGQDLIADVVAAKELYGYPCLIADLGTASKILLIDKEGFFSSCVIMPGLVISAEVLFSKGEQLPNVSLDVPKSVIGRNTIDCMNIGIVYGHSEMIKGLVRKTEEEIGYPCKHILTGGASYFIKDIMPDFIIDEDLTIKGLKLILDKNKR